MSTNQPTADYGTLTDYTTGVAIRPATAAEHAQSLAAGETGAYADPELGTVFVAGGPETATTTRTLAVRIDTVRTDRKTGEIISTWSPHLTYPCTADTATQQAADVLRTHHTREAQPDGTWRNQPAPARGDGTVLDSIDWRETATLVGDWTDAERDEIRRIVDRDRHLPGGG
jgi:hypothetical protein